MLTRFLYKRADEFYGFAKSACYQQAKYIGQLRNIGVIMCLTAYSPVIVVSFLSVRLRINCWNDTSANRFYNVTISKSSLIVQGMGNCVDVKTSIDSWDDSLFTESSQI